MNEPIPFLQAKHYRKGPRSKVDWVVIHSAEIGESLAGAEALMGVCAVNPRVASWHYATDADSITQSVREEDVAFHAPGASQFGIGIELSGRARQTADEWADDFSTRMLDRAAQLVARICRRWSIPIVFVDSAGLLAGTRGITTHAAVSKAWKKSTHWDPGPHFPMERFVELVQSYFERLDTEPAPPPSTPIPTDLPTLRKGSKGEAVAEAQRRLNAIGQWPPLDDDGDFGAKTLAAVERFQFERGLNPDGVVGAKTWSELLK